MEKLDEGRQALTIATGWLRTKARPRATIDPDDPPPEASYETGMVHLRDDGTRASS
jgi:hypothetical protein